MSIFDELNRGWEDFPAPVLHMGKRCLLDLIGVAAAGSQTDLSKIMARFVGSQYGGSTARLILNGTRVSPIGAALYGAATIDAFDAHDGHPEVKGHAGCGLLPVLIAASEEKGSVSGPEFLRLLILGYEASIRAGLNLHSSVSDYHTSGAWVAVGSAYVAGHLLGLTQDQIAHAMGTAEYYGPRSQMMRVIDHPTMLKDGSAWGALAGMSSVLLARDGFTGAPAITLDGEAFDHFGSRWMITEQYFKPYPVCRWAQPAVAALIQLQNDFDLDGEMIDKIDVFTFHEGARLATAQAQNTEEAQYSLPFPLAAQAVRGKVGALEITQNGLSDPKIIEMTKRIHLGEEDRFNAVFPKERWARLEVTLKNGEVLKSKDAVANGSMENPLSDQEINDKFATLMSDAGFGHKVDEVMALVWDLENQTDVAPLLDLILSP